MSLLFDENLSPALPGLIADLFPGSYHLQHFNYSSMPDVEIWRLAQRQGLCIVSCDTDFYWLSFQFGPPPKVVWIQSGAANTAGIEACIRANRDALAAFLNREADGLLVLTA
ncbi:hypothetical protein PLCT2_00383 [Planctomycetaceae bacterium]|nr:hypothetical protein PLCT2_00383 [Planctomycetaceae bacterium]